MRNPHENPTRIGIVVGSLAAKSINRRLATAITHLIGDRAVCVDIPIDIPLYNYDLDDNVPAAVHAMKRQFANLDGALFATPEYNRSMPAALKNVFEWGMRPWPQNIFKGMPAGIVGAAPGSIGTALAQHDLRNTLAHIGMPTLTLPEVFLTYRDEDFDNGHVVCERTRAYLQEWVDSFLAHVELHRQS
ncbi:MAG: hypothetical protein CSA58_00570 [Micrococcales bacterium]|nr:MAG: hypothetical protein CSB46_09295 [Micrococcales bacterium]PIE28140.1 MAG: hypothetical protein CSA58_00570 [Micrococcales bacterium]